MYIDDYLNHILASNNITNETADIKENISKYIEKNNPFNSVYNNPFNSVYNNPFNSVDNNPFNSVYNNPFNSVYNNPFNSVDNKLIKWVVDKEGYICYKNNL